MRAHSAAWFHLARGRGCLQTIKEVLVKINRGRRHQCANDQISELKDRLMTRREAGSYPGSFRNRARNVIGATPIAGEPSETTSRIAAGTVEAVPHETGRSPRARSTPSLQWKKKKAKKKNSEKQKIHRALCERTFPQLPL